MSVHPNNYDESLAGASGKLLRPVRRCRSCSDGCHHSTTVLPIDMTSALTALLIQKIGQASDRIAYILILSS